MKLLLCRQGGGVSGVGDLRVQVRARGIRWGGDETKGRNTGWSRRSAKDDTLHMGGSTAIGDEGEGGELATQLNYPPGQRTAREATRSTPRHPPVEGVKNCFAHFHSADPFAGCSNGVERQVGESRNPPCRSTRALAVLHMYSHQGEKNKSSCFTGGDPLINSADLSSEGGKGSCMPTSHSRQVVGNPPARVMNIIRRKIGHTTEGKKKFTCMDHSNCSACLFVKKVNRAYRCIRKSGVGHLDHCAIGKHNEQKDTTSSRMEDGVSKKRGILRGEQSKNRGSHRKVGLRVQWEDGSSGQDERGDTCDGNSDGASDYAQFRIDGGEEKGKELSTPGGSVPKRNSAGSEEETMEDVCATCFGRGGPPQQSDLVGECTYSEVDAYMHVFRENLDNSTMVDDMTDLQPIHVATKEGNMELVKKMIRSGIYINSKTKTRKFTPLHLSASKGDLDSVQFLIEHDADVNALSCDNETPLWCASMANHLEVCKYLLTHGGLPNYKTGGKQYDSPLHAASMMGHFEVVKLLTEYGADVSCLDSNQLEPLHYASFEGHKGIVKYLMWEQIRKAVHTKMEEVIKAMHKYGVYSKTLEKYYSLKCKAFYKKKVTSKILCCAITSGKDKIVDVILRRGADPNYFDVRLQLFPIHAASITGNLKIFKSLVRRGANIYATTGCNNSAMDLTEDVEIKRYILQHSRKINLRNAWLVRARNSAHVLSRLSPDAFYYVCTFL
ncbi:hypothetical protein AK88_00483 [Plasmodium fragile]|uniref:Uncharacterized protein n=1 Tax=Plasmodium fragile TaxID=5857 RepID=A0A0D9QRQ3_PLAFR|nr:uncharacterized protein AK88_00483 [Plasmodium fragile]KJP89775.1 hypothetical protein AK88_00483 [Plasmodium fragile]